MISLCKPTRTYTPDADDEAAAALLDLHETSVEAPNAPPVTHELQPATEGESTFRHSGWREKRDRTRDCLMRAGSTPTTMERFNHCGSVAWVMADQANKTRLRVQCQRCRSRWCEACGRERRALIQQNLTKHLPKAVLRFMTLTLKSNGDPPDVAIRRLYASFRKLRQRQKMKDRIRGGIAFLELTYSPERRQFHPHLHIIWQGSYVPHQQLRNEWLSITGDSFIVDVRPIPRPDYAVGYVAKYASKSIGPSIWRDPDAFVAVIRGMKAIRTLFTFGTWKGFKLLQAPTDDATWVTLGKLDDIWKRALNGDREAIEILRFLDRYIPGNEHADAMLFSDDG